MCSMDYLSCLGKEEFHLLSGVAMLPRLGPATIWRLNASLLSTGDLLLGWDDNVKSSRERRARELAGLRLKRRVRELQKCSVSLHT